MDLTILSAMAEEPNLLVVRSDSKYKSVRDLIEDARQRPDKVKMAIGNVGGSEHLIITRIQKATGVRFNVTAFGGSAPPYTSILGGHTDFTFTGPADVLESARAGKLRILAVAGERRAEAAPYAPTLKEEGYNVSLMQLRGYRGPPEMPEYAAKFWGQAYAKLSKTQKYQDLLKKMKMIPAYIGPEELRTFMPEYVSGLATDLKNLEVYGGKKK